MALSERLAQYGMSQPEPGTLVVASVNNSPQLEIRIEGHGAMIRHLLPDGSEFLDGGSTWRSVDRETLLWWIAQGNPIADWLLARGVDPAGVV